MRRTCTASCSQAWLGCNTLSVLKRPSLFSVPCFYREMRIHSSSYLFKNRRYSSLTPHLPPRFSAGRRRNGRWICSRRCMPPSSSKVVRWRIHQRSGSLRNSQSLRKTTLNFVAIELSGSQFQFIPLRKSHVQHRDNL